MYYKLFNINALHSYYKDGICKNLSIVPTADCLKKIKNCKLLFRQTGNGFKIAYKAVDDLGTPLIDASGLLFTFVITLKDANELLNITNLNVDTQVFTSRKVLHFANNPVEVKTLTHKFIDYLKPQIFNYQLPFKAINLTSDIASLEVLAMNGTTILGPFTPISPDNDGCYYKKINLTGYPSGKYTFRVSDTNNTPRDELIYIDNELSKQTVFGLLEIEYHANTLDEYEISLIRQESFWKYLIVNKSGSIDLESYNLFVKDTGNENPYPYLKRYKFTKGQEPDPVVRVNGYDTIVFTSKVKIPFYEEPLSSIELVKTDKAGGSAAEGITLIKHLPNPKIAGVINKKSESEIYVFI